MCMLMLHFLSLFHTLLDRLGSLSASVPLSSFVPLSALAPIPDATAPRSQYECTEQLASKPLQVFTCWPNVPASPSTLNDPFSPIAGPPQESLPPSDLDVPIALRKGKRFCTAYLISHFVSYDCLTHFFCQFTPPLSSISRPKSYKEALLAPA